MLAIDAIQKLFKHEKTSIILKQFDTIIWQINIIKFY